MIPFDQQVEKFDNDAVELALLALKESKNGLSCAIEKIRRKFSLWAAGNSS